jgi:hypothetical protein
MNQLQLLNQSQLLAEIAETRDSIWLFKAALQAAILDRRYDPEQPRVPAGSPGGGRWTSGADGEGLGLPIEMMAGRRRSRAYCDAQYDRDIFQCKMVGLSTCYAQAMVRLVACERGFSIPPLNY